jgi:periplasmic divalent cation tolerance protein
MPQLVLILTTFPDGESARKFAAAVVDIKLAACATVFPPVESIFRWEGKIEEGREVMVMVKTVKEKVEALHAVLKEGQKYELPEFIILDAKSSREYTAWVEKETSGE